MTPVALFAMAACAAVAPGSDRVLLRDVAAAFPPGSISGAEAPIALAPAPGVERVFSLAELRRIAARLNVGAAPDREACVTRAVAPLEPERVLAAMRAAVPRATVELVDYSRWPVPEGTLEFPLSGLRQDYWRGVIRYAGGHRFSVWAKVNVRISLTRVVAARDLPAGRAIPPDALRLETVEEAPAAEPYPVSIQEVSGKLPRRPIRAGTAIPSQWLAAAPLVTRGEPVKVEVRSGAASIEFEGRAESSGAAGQSIPVLNPLSGKRFRARVAGRGRVLVEESSL